MLLLFYVKLKWLGNLPNSPSQNVMRKKCCVHRGWYWMLSQRENELKKKSKEHAKLKKELKNNRYFLSFSRTNSIKLPLGFPSDQKVFC